MAHDAVDTAIRLRSQILAARAETEAIRELPGAVVSALVDAQLFRLAVPADLGGLELEPSEALDVYEELARAEASVAWLVWNSTLPCFFSRFLSSQVRAEIFGNPRWKYGSSTRPTGKATLQNGRFRLSGRWSLVSGCTHADWLGLMFLVEEGGQVQMVAPGVPHMRMAFVPSESCQVLDTWHVGGLRGTGSHDVIVQDLAVPEDRTVTPMDRSQLDGGVGRMPIVCTMSAGHAAICLGLARAALEAVVSLARTKVSADAVPGLRDRAANQSLVAEAATKIAAMRAHLHDTLDRLWATAESGADWSLEDLADVWSAAITTARECRSLVTSMYEVAGTPALYVDCVLERCHRDIHAALQHVVVQRLWLEEAGRVRMALTPTNPMFTI
jgi:indole-3-acetate monooxygenase